MHLKLAARMEKRQIILNQNIPINHLLADNPILEKDYQSILLEAIDKLSPQQQKVYQLSRTEGLKREEIAAKLGISPETVKIHIGKAMKIIRAYCVSRLNPPLILFFVYNYL
jgi:RNA polymerase sigma-70 factor (ECF subfamily)